jgi:hypothetical protein
MHESIQKINVKKTIQNYFIEHLYAACAIIF